MPFLPSVLSIIGFADEESNEMAHITVLAVEEFGNDCFTLFIH